ncbi:glycerophosphodiester phosphodiesterase 1 isoform X2 [Ischnura elegans]|uniref:glycerophosphodiester phosphodiesterase 1 isoform X2 n=1 Tax=Ischnura elegans TaxID=197161 RepID=UPI001ED866DE|nr:glycerophosphodiester phosphodiesterase 1 isoform X2 [Ischnura elegans]
MAQSVKWAVGTCFIAWMYIYGFLLLCFDTLASSFPPTLLGSVILFVAYHYLKLPPPDDEQVELLLGRDPWLDDNNEITALENSTSNEESSGDSDKTDKGEKILRNLKVIAHRGAGLDAPENSIASFRKCKDRGCNAVEFDVSLTSDGVPVIFHDRFVDRVSDGNGEISLMTLSEARKLDISHKHPFREWYKGERIPTLEEAVKECLSLDLTMFIDIKVNDVRTVPHILGLFGKEVKAGDLPGLVSTPANVWMPPSGTNMHSKAIVTTFHPYLIYLIRRADPRIACTLGWRPFSISSVSYSASAALGPAGMHGCTRPQYSGMFTNLGARIMDEIVGWCFQRGIPYHLLGLSGLLIHKDFLSPLD